jgi:hypothetical protein
MLLRRTVLKRKTPGPFCVARKREDPGLTADRSSMWILIAMEEVLIMATAGAGRL